MRAAGVAIYCFVGNLWEILLPVHFAQLYEPFFQSKAETEEERNCSNNYPWSQLPWGDTNTIEVSYFLFEEIPKRRSGYLARRSKWLFNVASEQLRKFLLGKRVSKTNEAFFAKNALNNLLSKSRTTQYLPGSKNSQLACSQHHFSNHFKAKREKSTRNWKSIYRPLHLCTTTELKTFFIVLRHKGVAKRIIGKKTSETSEQEEKEKL